VVTGGGSDVGRAIVDHDDVAYISFTGSGEVGWGIAASAPRKRVALELGNNTPIIVEADSDWETAARKISVAAFSHAGQSCISAQRAYVHDDVVDDFSAVLAEHVADLRVGDPLDPDTDVSALISERDRDRVKAWIDEAVAGGAGIVVGGEIRARLLQPTVLRDVTPDMKVCRDEVFGPVLGIQAYARFEEALRLADDSKYGLQAGIFTSDIGKALQAARALHYGGVTINEVPT
jgi:acyl-CoA reductase-like NAD-dependent aldehyde dehydrogenase